MVLRTCVWIHGTVDLQNCEILSYHGSTNMLLGPSRWKFLKSIFFLHNPFHENFLESSFLIFSLEKGLQKFFVSISCGPHSKISGTKTVPLGHHLIVRKTVPFGAPFWCHSPKGHCLSIHFLYKNSARWALK